MNKRSRNVIRTVGLGLLAWRRLARHLTITNKEGSSVKARDTNIPEQNSTTSSTRHS